MYLSALDSELEVIRLAKSHTVPSTYIIHVVTSDLSFLNTDFTKEDIVIPFKRKRFVQA